MEYYFVSSNCNYSKNNEQYMKNGIILLDERDNPINDVYFKSLIKKETSSFIHKSFTNIIVLIGAGASVPVSYTHLRNLCKKLAVSSINGNFGMTIFGNRRGCDLSSAHMCHKLGSITDAKDRNSHCKKFLVTKQCIFCINTVRTAGNNNSLWR